MPACRHHRYIFEEKKPGKAAKEDAPKVGARLQELGPRFTLKLRSLQVGMLRFYSHLATPDCIWTALDTAHLSETGSAVAS